MRLLVLDEASQAVGGIDTLRRFLIPALARQLGQVWWMSPGHLHRRRLEDLDLRHVRVLDLVPPTRSAAGLALAAVRRLLPRDSAAPRVRLTNLLARRHLRDVCRTLRITHVLEICVFRQPLPPLDLPRAGIVHDLDYPDRGCSPVDDVFRGWLRGAIRLFADSRQTEAELTSLAPDAAHRIEVLPLAPTPAPAATPASRPARWQHRVPVLYCPSSASMRKGLDTLFAALHALDASGVPFHCYCSGLGTDLMTHEDPAGEPGIEAVRRACLPWRAHLRPQVTGLGWQPWSVVEELYAAADVVVLPSRREGFGLPLGEALRRDRPVVATRLMPFADQAAFFDAHAYVRWFAAHDPTELATVLMAILSGDRPFPSFTTPLRTRLATWTWDTYAARLIRSLRDADQPATSDGTFTSTDRRHAR